VFSVSNKGSRPVYDVNAGCEIIRVDELPPGNRHFLGSTTFYFPESRAEILPPRHKMTVPCGRAIATRLDNVETSEVYAQMFIVVTYKPKGLWWHKSEKFPMETIKHVPDQTGKQPRILQCRADLAAQAVAILPQVIFMSFRGP
jgi:hypothetical protein